MSHSPRAKREDQGIMVNKLPRARREAFVIFVNQSSRAKREAWVIVLKQSSRAKREAQGILVLQQVRAKRETWGIFVNQFSPAKRLAELIFDQNVWIYIAGIFNCPLAIFDLDSGFEDSNEQALSPIIKVTFSLGQKRCHYSGKCNFFEKYHFFGKTYEIITLESLEVIGWKR